MPTYPRSAAVPPCHSGTDRRTDTFTDSHTDDPRSNALAYEFAHCCSLTSTDPLTNSHTYTLSHPIAHAKVRRSICCHASSGTRRDVCTQTNTGAELHTDALPHSFAHAKVRRSICCYSRGPLGWAARTYHAVGPI